MPNRKRTGMLFENKMFRKRRPCRENAIPPIITVEEALSAGRQLGYIENPTPTSQEEADLCPEEDWDDVDDAGECCHQVDDPDPSNPIPEPASERYSRLTQGRYFSEKRQRLMQQWSSLEHELTATFFDCQHRTSNWTPQHSYLSAFISCQCEANLVVPQKVDLIDILGRQHEHPIDFCGCTESAVRLLQLGYFASSPEKPRTAFSIPLVQLHHRLWQTSAISTSNFIEALTGHLND